MVNDPRSVANRLWFSKSSVAWLEGGITKVASLKSAKRRSSSIQFIASEGAGDKMRDDSVRGIVGSSDEIDWSVCRSGISHGIHFQGNSISPANINKVID